MGLIDRRNIGYNWKKNIRHALEEDFSIYIYIYAVIVRKDKIVYVDY